MSSRPKKITPMLRQYLAIKDEHRDAILFYRMGDFYEMFLKDAEIASRVLGITLTSRSNKNAEEKIPMCGVPFHAASGYLARLVKAGHKVAICEQTEDPAEARGLVRREVVRVISPGVVTEDELLDEKNNCYLAAVSRSGEDWGLAILDLSTGEFLLSQRASAAEIEDELLRLAPSELLLADDMERGPFSGLIDLSNCHLTLRDPADFNKKRSRETLLSHFNTTSLAGFGCEDMDAATSAAGALVAYVQETQKSDLGHIDRLRILFYGKNLQIDESSRRNLELTRTIIGNQRQGSLLSILDRTSTPMGARLLRKNILLPLLDPEEINLRLDTVGRLIEDEETRTSLGGRLDQVYDLERLNTRVVLGRGNGRDLVALKLSLARLPEICELCGQAGVMAAEIAGLNLLEELVALLDSAISEDSPVAIKEGGIIREGFNPELDELQRILSHGKEMILDLEARERKASGIANLKIGFNRVFGYYLEVSKGQLAHVPDYFIRKQTLVNAERFITPELKEFEEKVANAEVRALELEYRLFGEIRDQVSQHSSAIIQAAQFVAWIDFYASLAEVAAANRYCRPQVNESGIIRISEGRHPVIEQAMEPERFVPNDILLDQEKSEVLIITGPNMAGKSTVLRQTALIVLMAQMGSFIPAESAEIGVVDRIFTRVGAMDDLRRAQSTFMVEMNETANILNNATDKSLVILDEIGRGTSTYDGLAIAWAVTEDLVEKNGRGVKTIFATHYHELTDMALTCERIKNFNIAVREWNDLIVFLHKLLPGATNRSYGIQVAGLAGVPARVVDRAREILTNIEKGEMNRYGEPKIAAGTKENLHHTAQLSLFTAPEDRAGLRLKEINPNELTPLAALNLIYELKGLQEGNQG